MGIINSRVCKAAGHFFTGRSGIAVAFFSAAAILGVAYPEQSEALPFFARQVGRDCTYCHTSFPRLNEKGRIFKSNGYRFDGDEWLDVKDLSALPISAEVEVEGGVTKVARNKVTYSSNDLLIESGEIMAGGAFGRTGKLTGMIILNLAQTGRNDTGFSSMLHKTFVQVNDLVGAEGAGALNLRAGQWQIGLPFLSAVDTPVANRYLAESALDILTFDQRAIELNGASGLNKNGENGEDGAFVSMHRYGVGAARGSVYSASKVSGFYAYYSAVMGDLFNVGALYRGGTESYMAADTRYSKYALAASADIGSFTITAAHMGSKRQYAPSYRDDLVEILYKPVKNVTAGGRLETVSTPKKRYASAGTFMVRYNIVSSAFAQFEYRVLSDRDYIVGVNEREDKFRFFISAAF